jgi:hypothetical protein
MVDGRETKETKKTGEAVKGELRNGERETEKRQGKRRKVKDIRIKFETNALR